MALPLPADLDDLIDPSGRTISAPGQLQDFVTNSFNYLSGGANGFLMNYDDLSAFAWWYDIPSFEPNDYGPALCVEHVGITVFNREMIAVDRIVPGSGEGRVLAGTKWTLTNAPSHLVGGCLAADVVTSRPLNIAPRFLIAIDTIGTNLQVQRVYIGRIDSPPINTKSLDPETGEIIEAYAYHLVGLKAFAGDLMLIDYLYEGVDVGLAFRDIAENVLAVQTPIIYEEEHVDITNYEIISQAFQGVNVMQALDTLANLAGLYSWGVDVYGRIYLKPRVSDMHHHLWLDKHPVDLQQLEADTDNIVNIVYVETDEFVFFEARDEVSIAQWGPVERIVKMPTSGETVVPTPIAISSITGSQSLVNASNALTLPGSYAAMPGADIGDYIDITMASSGTFSRVSVVAPLTGLLGGGSPYTPPLTLELRDAALNVLATASVPPLLLLLLNQGITFTFPPTVTDGFRITILARTPVPEWRIQFVSASVFSPTDPYQLGRTLVDLWKDPITVGKLKIMHGCFITPTGLRLTDVTGNTYRLDIDEMTYELTTDGLVIDTTVGRGRLNLQRAIVFQRNT